MLCSTENRALNWFRTRYLWMRDHCLYSKDFRPFFYRYIDYLDRKQRTIHRPQCFLLISAVSTLKRVTKIILWNALFVETFLLKGNLMFTSYLFMTLMFRNLNQTKRVKSTFRLVLVMFMINHL